ncbi:MAG TPA: tetratricopeptide repeat protein, partial [Chitinophagales bacterium]|nr:tetratricopeptide repeat protein [Chitinophagales bacterium]
LWLYAQTEYWLNHISKSKKAYRKAMALNPDNDYLQLDYAKELVDLGDLKQADTIIARLQARGKNYSAMHILKARIAFDNGNYNQTNLEAYYALQLDKGNTEALGLYEKVAQAKAPWLKTGIGYTNDDQPMQTIAPSIEAGIYLHRYAALQLGFYSPVFYTNGSFKSAQIFQAGDVTNFSQIGLLLQANAGVVKYPTNRISWLGNLYISKTFIKHLVVEVQAEEKPYFYTISSIDSVVNAGHFVFSLGWNDKSTWNGKASFDFNYFNDKNYAYSAYAWLFAPPIKFWKAELRFGYSYNFSNANTSHFVSSETLAQIISNYATTQQITGVYTPYFTPNMVQTHSALVSFDMEPIKALSINVHANIGFYASAQTPYLYLDNYGGETVIARDYFRNTFWPFNVGASLSWQANRAINLSAEYTYTSSYFFSSHYAGLSLKASFLNGKKKK